MSSFFDHFQIAFSLLMNCINLIAPSSSQSYLKRWLLINSLKKKIEWDQLIALHVYSGLSSLEEMVEQVNQDEPIERTKSKSTKSVIPIKKSLFYMLQSNKNDVLLIARTLKALKYLAPEYKSCNTKSLFISDNNFERKLLSLALEDVAYRDRDPILSRNHALEKEAFKLRVQPEALSESLVAYFNLIENPLRKPSLSLQKTLKITLTNTPNKPYPTKSLNSAEINKILGTKKAFTENGENKQNYEPIVGRIKSGQLTSNQQQVNQKEENMKTHNNKVIMEKIFHLIAEGDARIKNDVENGILIFGRTGAGKSTLTHLLTGQQLQAFTDDITGNRIVDAVVPLEDINISHREESGTTVPGKQKVNNVIIWDLPGFNDTNAEQEIANAFYTRRVSETTKKLKFILAMSEAAITSDRGSNAIAIIEQFARVFNDPSSLENCVSLVVTQVVPGKKVIHLQNNLIKIMNENPLIRDNENVKKILGYLLKSVNIFYAPDADGLMNNTNNLFQNIEKTTDYLLSKANLINIAINKDSIPYVKELLKASESNLAKITDIIVLALKEANLCMNNSSENVFVNAHNFIKGLLPTSYSLIKQSNESKNISNEHFVNLDQLSALANALPDHYTGETIKQTISNLLGIFKDFATPTSLKQQIDEYIHVFQQQMEYVKFLSEVCEAEDVNYSYVLSAMSSCKTVVNNEYKSQLTSLKLDHVNDASYYIKAIKYLNCYPEEVECVTIKAQCYNQLGSISEATGDYKKALVNYITAIKLDNTLPDTYEKIGNILYNQKNYNEAIKYFKVGDNSLKIENCFKELIKIDPNNAALRLEKGDYYLSIGCSEKAIKYYKDASCLSKDAAIKTSLLLKQSDAMEHLIQTLSTKAQELKQKAKNTDFYNFNEFQFGDFENDSLLLIGDNGSEIEENYS